MPVGHKETPMMRSAEGLRETTRKLFEKCQELREALMLAKATTRKEAVTNALHNVYVAICEIAEEGQEELNEVMASGPTKQLLEKTIQSVEEAILAANGPSRTKTVIDPLDPPAEIGVLNQYIDKVAGLLSVMQELSSHMEVIESMRYSDEVREIWLNSQNRIYLVFARIAKKTREQVDSKSTVERHIDDFTEDGYGPGSRVIERVTVVVDDINVKLQDIGNRL